MCYTTYNEEVGAVQQLNLWDIGVKPSKAGFSVGDRVQIKATVVEAAQQTKDQMDYFYLENYVGKVGVITKKYYSRTGTHYDVAFNTNQLTCYEYELEEVK